VAVAFVITTACGYGSPGFRRDDVGMFPIQISNSAVIASDSEAIQSIAHTTLDCFRLRASALWRTGRRYAPRNDGKVTSRYSRDGNRPSFASSFALLEMKRAQGRPGSRMHPGLPRKDNLRERVNHRYRR
jgi:hypothetical protein